MRLSVIIVSYNVRDLLRRCLQSVHASAQKSGDRLAVEVTVIDNASHDGSARMVAEEFPRVDLVASQENLGFPRANNLALRRLGFGTAADGSGAGESAPDFVLLLNPDTEILHDALERMAAFLRDTPAAGACGARLHYPDGALQHAAFAFPGFAQVALDVFPWEEIRGVRRLHRRLLGSRLNGRYALGQWLGASPFRVGFVLGAALMASRESIARAGLMDEGYFMYCEEMDWCLRMRAAGLATFAVPAAQIIHYEGRSSRQLRWKSFEHLWVSRFRFFGLHAQRYPPGFRPLLHLLLRLAFAWNAARARRRFARGKLAGHLLGEQLAAYARVLRPGASRPA